MSNALKKDNKKLDELGIEEDFKLKSAETIPKLTSFSLPELPKIKTREQIEPLQKSEDQIKVDNYRYTQEKEFLLEQISKLHIDIENKKNDLECTNALIQDKIKNKQQIISNFEKQEAKYLDHIKKLDEKIGKQKINIESNKQKLRLHLDKGKNKENELNSNLINIQREIEDSSKKSHSLLEQIETQTKRLQEIDTLIEYKENEIAGAKYSFETLQTNFNSLKLEYENLVKKHSKINDVIQNLENYERDLLSKRELAEEKLKNEIARNKLRFEIERQTQFKNLNAKLVSREQEWEKDFLKRSQKKEIELDKKIQQVEKEALDIHSKAREESSEIRLTADQILKDAYTERQRLLDEGSREKMNAMQFIEEQIKASQETAEKIKVDANNKLQDAHNYYLESEINAKKSVESARSKGESILRNADMKARRILKNAQLENEQITKKFKSEELEFQKHIEQRKEQLNRYLESKRERTLKNLEKSDKIVKQKEVKLRIKLEAENEKLKRKQLKKVIQLKDSVIQSTNEFLDKEKQKIKELKKSEFEKLFKQKVAVLAEIRELKEASIKNHKKHEEEQKIQLAQKEKIEEKNLNRRKEELENSYNKKTSAKIKEIEEAQKKNLDHLKSQFQEYLTNLCQENDLKLSNDKLKSEIKSIFENSFEEKKGKLLQNAGMKSYEFKSKDISTFITKYVYKIILPISLVSFVLFNGFGSRDAILSLGESAYIAIKNSSEDKEAQILKEERDKKTFSPTLTAGYKDTYVDNVLYTKDFLTVYESDQFQNDWLLAAYNFISNELELNEEVAIQFISAEGAFIKELSETRKNIDARFAKDHIEKMRKMEESAFTAQIETFVTDDNWLAFQAFKDDFFSKHF